MHGLPLKCISVFGVQNTNDTSEPATAKGCLSSYKLQIDRGDKTQLQTRLETQRRPVARPLADAEVLVAVRGPSPGEGGGKKLCPTTAPAARRK